MRVKVIVVSAVMAVTSVGVLGPAHSAVRHAARPFDLNGDGYTDLVVGAPVSPVNGVRMAGSLTVLFGGPRGISSKRAQYITQASPGVPGDLMEGTFSASSFASGDFDGDGYADLAVTTFDGQAANGGQTAVVLFRGSALGLRTKGSVRWRLPVVDDGSSPTAVVADFNRDGRADLVVSDPGADVGGVAGAGAIFVYAGSRHGLSDKNVRIWSQASPGVPGTPRIFCPSFGEAPPDSCDDPVEVQFGGALAEGDFDGDGYPDLAVGVPGQSIGDKLQTPLGKHMVGAVEVFRGTARGLLPTPQFWTQDSPGVPDRAEGNQNTIDGPYYGDEFGAALTAADFNGDGRADLAVGVPGEEPGNALSCFCTDGAVNVLLGTRRGLTGRRGQFWPAHALRQQGIGPGGVGAVLTAGDFNGDGRPDLALGAPVTGVAGHSHAGAVAVLLASRQGLTSRGRQLWTQNSRGILGKSEDDDRFGWALAAGHFRPGRPDDLAVGVPLENYRGLVQVIHGSRNGLTASGNTAWSQDTPGIPGSSSLFSEFGAVLNAPSSLGQ